MGDLKLATEQILVHLDRPEVGVRTYQLAEGATLADLFRQAEVSTTHMVVLVDGMSLGEGLPLSMGAVVSLAPRPGVEPWRAAVPAFRDEAILREYDEALSARRHEVIAEEGPGG